MGYRKQPSKYRFVFELQPTFLAVVFAFVLDRIGSILCVASTLSRSADPCTVSFPAWMWWGAFGVGLWGIGASAYRFYRDFYQGQYYLDCMR